MAISNQIECNSVVGCRSTQSSPEMTVQRPTSPTSRPNPVKGVSAIIAVILETVIASYKRYQNRVALTRLSDNQLRDIGLERAHDGRIGKQRF